MPMWLESIWMSAAPLSYEILSKMSPRTNKRINIGMTKREGRFGELASDAFLTFIDTG